MKKKVFAIITMLILVVSLFTSVPVMADEAATEEIGGLDLYSITIHYEKPVLVSMYKTKVEVLDDNGKTKKVNVEYFLNTDAENEDGKYADGDKSLTTDKLVIPVGDSMNQYFNQITTSADAATKFNTGLWYSKKPYKNAFLTHIVNGSAISTSSKVDLFGITTPYDDAPYEHQNPNVKYADDGYALAIEKDANGNNLKIDVNGYLIDTNDNIWKTSNNERVEMYVQVPVIKKTGLYKKLSKCPECKDKRPSGVDTYVWTCKNGHEVKGDPVTDVILSDEYMWVPFNDRFDENGKIKKLQDINYMYYVTEDEYQAFLENDSQNTLAMKITDDKEIFADTKKEQKFEAFVGTYIVDKNKDPNSYWNKDRVFTQSDMVVDAMGFVAYATPKGGTPLLNAKIKDITVEIDALGEKLYDDIASDPQQKNTITLSINDCEYNSNLYKQWFEEGCYSQDEYDALGKFVIGTAKSETTRTEINMDKKAYKSKAEYGYSPTVKSISVGSSAEVLAKIPASAKIFVDFDIYQQQPAAAWDDTYKKEMILADSVTKDSTVINEKIEILTDANKPAKKVVITTQTDSSFPTWAIIAIIAGGVILVAAIVVVVVIVIKKKKKA